MVPESEAHTAQLEQLTADVASLVQHLRGAHPPADTLVEVQQHVQAALQLLAPLQTQGEGWSTISIADQRPALNWSDEDLTACMPYSPVSGKRNPIAPSVRLRRVGDEVQGEARFNETYAGPPDSVHGGFIAVVFDELLSMATVISGEAGFTGTLTVRYHQKTPLGKPIELWSKMEDVQGRKLITRGEMRFQGAVTASAEAIFVCTAELENSAVRLPTND
jgi:acyl-coenzyme A thioesterase PaaI-like protein